jgi:hypothetical protein
MWYRVSQTGIGGGILSPTEAYIQKLLHTPQLGDTLSEASAKESAEIPHPIEEDTSDYQQRLWDSLVNRDSEVGSDNIVDENGNIVGKGPATDANEARRLSPFHQNPEETPMETQLEAVRQQNVNNADSMSSTEGTRGNVLVRGEFPYASGKGWDGYQDLPTDKSWA